MQLLLQINQYLSKLFVNQFLKRMLDLWLLFIQYHTYYVRIFEIVKELQNQQILLHQLIIGYSNKNKNMETTKADSSSVFIRQSQKVVSATLSLIDDQLWQKIAEKNVIKMAPKNIQRETHKTLQSFGMIGEDDGNAGKKKFALIKKQIDPLPAIGDKLKQGVIRIQTKFRTISQSSNGKKSMSNNSKFFRKSMHKSKVISSVLRSNTQNSISSISKSRKLEGNNKFTPLITEVPQQVDLEQNRLWKVYLDAQKTKKEQQIAEKIRLKQIEENNIKNLKKFRELKKVTFDYEGKFFGISNNSNGKSKVINIKPNFTTDSVNKKIKDIQQSGNPFTPRIIANSRLKQRNKIMMQEKNTYEESIIMYEKLKTCTGIMNTFANQDSISEGVTIKENQTIKSKPWKGSDSNISKNMKLSEFKGLTRGRNFKDYSTIRAKTLQTLQNSQRVTQLKINTPINERIIKTDAKENLRQSLTNKLRSEPRLAASLENQVNRFKSAANINIQTMPMAIDQREDSIFLNSDQKRKIRFKTNSILNAEASLTSIMKGKGKIGNINIQNEQLYSSIVDDVQPIF